MDETFEGGCTCRAIRYAMKSRPIVVHACHCTWCQRETGTSYALNAVIERDRVTFTTEPEIIVTPSLSGAGQKIARCPTCRVALYSHYRAAGDRFCFIRVGTLDEPGRIPPDIHIYTSTKQPWVVLAPDARAFAEFYDPAKEWPAESLARYRAAKA